MKKSTALIYLLLVAWSCIHVITVSDQIHAIEVAEYERRITEYEMDIEYYKEILSTK